MNCFECEYSQINKSDEPWGGAVMCFWCTCGEGGYCEDCSARSVHNCAFYGKQSELRPSACHKLCVDYIEVTA